MHIYCHPRIKAHMTLHQNINNTGGRTPLNSAFIRACICKKQREGIKVPEEREKTTEKQ